MHEEVLRGTLAALPESLRLRAEALANSRIVEARKPDTGMSAAHRLSVTFENGRRAFLKEATDAHTEDLLRNEYLALTHVPEPFRPEVLWWDDVGRLPLLVTEDLSRAHWPANHSGVDWRPGDIEIVLAATRALSGLQAPDVLAPAPASPTRYWRRIEGERAAFDAFGVCDPAWLDACIDVLAAAEESLDRTGGHWVHGDIRSDNTCILDGRAVFVDWSSARRGSAQANLAQLLPTLHLEGGPPPFEIMPDGGAWAAAGAADLARWLLDEAATAPVFLPRVARLLLRIDLKWAAASLELPPLPPRR